MAHYQHTRTVNQPADQVSVLLLVPLCVTAFLGILNLFAPIPFLTEIARDFSATVPAVAQIATGAAIVGAVFGLFAGPVADHFGHRRAIVFGLGCMAVSAFCSAVAPTFWLLLATRLLSGVGGAIVIGVNFAMAGSLFAGDARRRALGLIQTASVSSVILGGPILTSIAALADWRAAFIFVGLVGLLAMLAVWRTLPADRPRPTEPLSARDVLFAYEPLIRSRPMMRLFGAHVIRAIAWVGNLTFYGAFFIDQYDLSTQQVGFVFLAAGVGYAGGNLAAGGRPGGWLDLRLLYAMTTTTMGLMLAVMYTASPPLLLAIMLLIVLSLAAGAGFVAHIALISNETPARPATTMVLNSSLFSVGSALGAAVGGIAISLGGYGLLGVVIPIFAVVATLLVWQPHLTSPPAWASAREE